MRFPVLAAVLLAVCLGISNGSDYFSRFFKSLAPAKAADNGGEKQSSLVHSPGRPARPLLVQVMRTAEDKAARTLRGVFNVQVDEAVPSIQLCMELGEAVQPAEDGETKKEDGDIAVSGASGTSGAMETICTYPQDTLVVHACMSRLSSLHKQAIAIKDTIYESREEHVSPDCSFGAVHTWELEEEYCRLRRSSR